MRNIFFTILFVSALGIFFTNSYAQESGAPTSPPAQSTKGNAKNQVLDFEDEMVEGSAAKPDLFYIFQKKNFNYRRLIKMRDNFIPEMKKTSEDVHRVRSKD
jgi:hypothetical protein